MNNTERNLDNNQDVSVSALVTGTFKCKLLDGQSTNLKWYNFFLIRSQKEVARL